MAAADLCSLQTCAPHMLRLHLRFCWQASARRLTWARTGAETTRGARVTMLLPSSRGAAPSAPLGGGSIRPVYWASSGSAISISVSTLARLADGAARHTAAHSCALISCRAALQSSRVHSQLQQSQHQHETSLQLAGVCGNLPAAVSWHKQQRRAADTPLGRAMPRFAAAGGFAAAGCVACDWAGWEAAARLRFAGGGAAAAALGRCSALPVAIAACTQPKPSQHL